MASHVVSDYEQATELRVVDVLQLQGDNPAPPVDEHGCPTTLRAFTVCADPKITVFPNFFTDVECDHVLQMVEGGWMPSQVGSGSEAEYKTATLENKLSQTRTSWSCMMRYAQTDVVERLEHRLAAVAGLPVEQLERLNMVRYSPGELFSVHHDGHFRPKTVFVYLNDLPDECEGGDTFFPVLGYSFRPRRGTAVMWSNVTSTGEEDGRMIHAGRAPDTGVKYGVNCFFNARPMRHATVADTEFSPEQTHLVDIRELKPKDAALAAESERFVNYVVYQDPRICTVPHFLTPDEVDHIRKLLSPDCKPYVAGGQEGPMARGQQTLRVLEAEETEVVQAVEQRISGCCGISAGHLGPLRLVHPSIEWGLCNRGNGPASAYICLSESEEVFFPPLGLRLLLRAGDFVLIPNMYWEDNDTKVVEDLRTTRVHLSASEDQFHRSVGIDAYFYDSLIRQEQKKRTFVPDDGVLGGK
mmetsp:Transcript_59595/g.141803  ORF Transcript_59595/g.141803 Transcript_59595/m.141803 type:complete len:470 (-) Transcript_59595:85-1494(-)